MLLLRALLTYLLVEIIKLCELVFVGETKRLLVQRISLLTC